jgi:uncharacterized protein
MPARSDSAARRRASAAGFVLDTRPLGHGPGARREVQRTVTAPERIGIELIGIQAGACIDLELELQAVSEGVLVTGTLSAPIVGECGRCLTDFTDRLELQLTELFAYPDSATERTTDDDEVYRLLDDRIDLEPVLIDAVGLALPLQPLCHEDCPGLCPECGVSMAIAGPEHRHEILDPRWAGLATKVVNPAPEQDRQQ